MREHVSPKVIIIAGSLGIGLGSRPYGQRRPKLVRVDLVHYACVSDRKQATCRREGIVALTETLCMDCSSSGTRMRLCRFGMLGDASPHRKSRMLLGTPSDLLCGCAVLRSG
eukprot:6183348-Pleurochrysis_carterae.AAC.1